MTLYEFRAGTRTREVPTFGEVERARLEQVLDVRLDSYRPGLGAPVPPAEQRLLDFRECREDQCLFGIQTASSDVQITLGMLIDSSSVVITADHGRVTSADVVEGLRKELSAYFPAPDSISVRELSPGTRAVAQDRTIPSPSAYFASGTEWYRRLSPTIWQQHYDRDVILGAPVEMRILDDGSLEWYSYEDLLHLDTGAVTDLRTYLGGRRRSSST